jgi:hypothetical protein
MQKLFFYTLVGCFISYQTTAQEMGHVLWGLKLGYNYNLSSFKTNKQLPVTGVHGGYGGVMLKIPFDKGVYFMPQIDASYRGTKTDSLQKNELSSVKELHIRVMPLLQVEFNKAEGNNNTFFLQFGPSVGFGMKGTQVKQDGNNVPVKGNLKYGFQSYGRYDANFHAGLGYETTNGLRILLDYAHGLGNMINTEQGGRLKYRTISLGIGYWFGK